VKPPQDRRPDAPSLLPRRRAPWVVRLYPPSFRERYGSELTALVEDLGPNRLVATDLLLGAVIAWLRPAASGQTAERRRRRLQASIATTWVAWCAGFLVAPTVTRMLDDPPVPNMTPLANHLLAISQVSWWIGGLVLLTATVPLALRSLPAALRARDRHVIAPLVPAIALCLAELGGVGAILLMRPSSPPAWSHPSAAFVGTLFAEGIGFFAFVLAAGLGPAISLTRAKPPARHMRLPAVLGTVVAAALAVTTVTSLGAVLLTQAAPLSILAVAVAGVSTLVALTSSTRGLKAVVARD